MRLLQAMAGAKTGGAEAFFERLTIALDKHIGQQVVIRKNHARQHLLRDAGVVVHSAAFGGALDFRTTGQLKKLISDYQPTHILTWMNRASRAMPRSCAPHLARLGGYYNLKYYKKADYLIGNTPHLCEWLIGKGWERGRVFYLPNFAAAPTPAALPVGLVKPRQPLIVALGRLHPVKGFDVLIEAMRQTPQAMLWLVGSGVEFGALAKQAKGLENMRILPWQDNPSAILAAADIIVCPSRHEPLGNVMVEAFAHGKAVVASNTFGAQHLIKHQQNGLIVPTENADALAEAINQLLANPAQSQDLAAAGHTRWQAEFSEAVVVQRYLALLGDVREK